MDSAWMETFATGLADEGVRVARFEFLTRPHAAPPVPEARPTARPRPSAAPSATSSAIQ